MKRSFSLILSTIIVTAIISACATTKPIQEVEAPKWVIKGSGAFDSKNTRVFHGVGFASGINNPSLLRTTSENRARNEIAKIFKVYVSSLMKDYAASTQDLKANSSSEEQHIEQVVKTITSETLTGVEIIDYWQDSNTGELFSLARLDLDAFESLINKTNELDAKRKEYIRGHAKLLHEELSREVDKLRKNVD